MKTLVVTPSVETKERLKRTFGQAPFTIDWETMLVPLAPIPYTQEANVKVSNATYFARVKDFRVLFDELRQTAELVAILDSPEMLKRAIDLGMSYKFQLKLVFLPYAPAMSQPVRNFMVSVSDTMVLKESHHPYSFQNEYLLG